ncbi:hypothetical protein LCGC14_2107320 [marine sediment metagenome]|uniref:Uncharacterized protein n=1 Tax=marine sediment metagenome TaxID=412755 RepID=A0A0F9E815_9ZZZZ
MLLPAFLGGLKFCLCSGQFGSTTTRGTGSAPPITYQKVTALTWSCDFNMLEKTDDASLELIKTAAAAGTPMALKMEDYSAGKGFDGDVVFSHKQGKPLAGEATHDFTAVPCNDATTPRVAQLYVA